VTTDPSTQSGFVGRILRHEPHHASLPDSERQLIHATETLELDLAVGQDAPAKSRSRTNDLADVTVRLRELRELDEHSAAFRRERDAIIERCLPLADNVAAHFRNRGESHEDLVQVARLGLVNAVKRFDPDSGSEFLPFAVLTMMGECRRYFRDHGWSLKVPRRLKELNLSLNAAKAELTHRLNRAPTASELAEHLGADRQEIVEGLIAANAYSTRSTDAPIDSDDVGFTVAERIGDLDADLEKVVDLVTVRPLLAALPDRERAILAMRFFENMTQSQIAQRIGMSQMHVSRLLARSLAALRDQLR
jgi:RNA polymerase sigma-B factor